MLKDIIIPASEETPRVEFYSNTGLISLKGRSLPENAFEFYKPLIGWVEDLKESSPNLSIEFTIDLDYFNSSSSRFLLELLMKLQAFGGADHRVLWVVDREDELMLDKGKEFEFLVNMKFEFIEK